MSKILSAARGVVKWLGYKKELLPTDYQAAVETYIQNGAVKKVGPVESIEILYRNDGSSPIHKSSFNPRDQADIISARIKPANDGPIRTHHIYQDGTGTIKKGDKREFSTYTK